MHLEILVEDSSGKALLDSIVPRIVGGRTMLPLRFISETFGADIFYDAVKQTVTVTMTRQA